jgi:hypothetical protein
MWSKGQNYVILAGLTGIFVLFTIFLAIDILHGIWLAILVDLFAQYGVWRCMKKVLWNIAMTGVFDR